MKKASLIFLLISILFIGCSKEEKPVSQTPINDEGVFIRVRNVSDYMYKKIVVEAGGTTNMYEDLDPSQTSDYQEFDSAYRYAYIEIEIDDKQYLIQPIDFVGETLLEDGFYTYEVSANEFEETYGRLGLLFIED